MLDDQNQAIVQAISAHKAERNKVNSIITRSNKYITCT